MGAKRAAVVWFGRDLRITDHEPLYHAGKGDYDYVVPVYCLDPRHFYPRRYLDGLQIPKTGPFRCR